MGYSNFLFLKEELSLIAVMLILLVYDLFGSQKSLKYFHPVACVLFLALPGRQRLSEGCMCAPPSVRS